MAKTGTTLTAPSITTAQHLNYDKAVAFAVAGCDAFNKAGVSMIAACGVVMIAGAYGAETKRSWDDTKKILTENLEKRGLGATQVSKYIGYAKEVCIRLVKRDAFGGDMHRILVAKDIKTAHGILVTHLDQVTKGKNTLSAVAVAIGKETARSPQAPGSRSEPSAADVLAGKDQQAKKRAESIVKAVNAKPDILASVPQETLLRSAEVIGFTTFVKKHVDNLTDTKALLKFKKDVDAMVTERLKLLKALPKPKAKAEQVAGTVESETATAEPQAKSA